MHILLWWSIILVRNLELCNTWMGCLRIIVFSWCEGRAYDILALIGFNFFSLFANLILDML
jgi:hypothetical protein